MSTMDTETFPENKLLNERMEDILELSQFAILPLFHATQKRI